MEATQHDNVKKQPAALYTLFFAEMWERFSFYGMRALLLLFMVRHMLYSDDKAYGIYAAYGALVYATPFIGGIISDRILGSRKSVIFGAVLMAIGEFCLAIQLAFQTQYFFFMGLSFLIIGNGFFKPNISSMVGGLYQQGDPRRDGGFTIFYMGINLGAFLAPLVCGIVGEGFGWAYGFLLAGIGMLIGLLVFYRNQGKLGDKNGTPPSPENLAKPFIAGLSLEKSIYLISFLLVPIFALLVIYNGPMSYMLKGFGLGILIYILVLSVKFEAAERQQLYVILILTLFSIIFWAFFEQAGSSISLFTDRNVNTTVFGFTIPTSVFQSVKPLFIVLLGPVFAQMWVSLKKNKIEPATPYKFTFGLLQLALGFGAFVLGASFAGKDGLVSVLFLLLGYFLHTTGELCLSPVGLSMVTKLSPKAIVAMMMGVWMFSSSMAHDVAGLFAKQTSTSQYSEQTVGFEAPLKVAGTANFSVNLYDQKLDKDGKRIKGKSGKEVDSLFASKDLNIKVVMEEGYKAEPKAPKMRVMRLYKSTQPGGSVEFDLRRKFLDPVGDLCTIEFGQQNILGKVELKAREGATEKELLNYTAPKDTFGFDTIRYKMIEKVSGESQDIQFIVTFDYMENHAPVLVGADVELKMPVRGYFSKFFGESEIGLNVLDYFVDLDGDPVVVTITKKPEEGLGLASVGSGLNSFVTPAKTIHIYSNVFFIIMIYALIATALLLVLSPILKKWMHGVQ